MAVYKATYCYPFLGSCDIRVAPGETQWITCKVDSSNKKITGYRITIYDENNNLIFPHYDPSSTISIYHKKDWNISPISELSYGGVLPRDDDGNLVIVEEDGTKIKLPSQEYLTNSGMNGSYLNLPFFQNRYGRVTMSANAVYYQPHYQAEYLIRNIAEGSDGYKTPENSSNWIKHSDGCYYYNKDENGKAIQDDFGFFTGKLNGDSKLRPNQTVLFYRKSNGDNTNAFLIGHLCYDKNGWSIEIDKTIEGETAQFGNTACVITRGTYHDHVYTVADSELKEFTGNLWVDSSDNNIPFSIGKTYKWVITLYQGDGKEMTSTEVNGTLMNYSNINVSEWYDMILQKGQILGSCPSRIQIAKYDDSAKEYLLPKNKDGSSVILYKTYAQLVAPNGNDVGSRFYVNTYSSSLGHIYPLESDANTITVEGADFVEFFKHSNNPEAILDTDMVDMASVKEHTYNAGDDGNGDDAGNVELCGLQNIDGVVGENGKYVLLMYQKKPTENGVYKMTDDSDNTISAKVSVSTTDDKGQTTESSVLKTYKRDSSKDEYNADGIPWKFAWTHEKTEEESNQNQNFELTLYTSHRYCKKDDEILSDGITYKISSVKMATWTRAGGYISWSNYVGKIIYVSGGDVNGGKNFASTAAEGTLLKKPYTDDQDASTPLYFVPERSVVLFSQLLNDDYSIKALGEFKVGSTTSADTVDGVILSSGDYYIEQSTGNIRLYTTSHNAGELIRSPGEDIKYYYINQGQTNGLQVCKIYKMGDNPQIDANSKDLNRAEVLKNTTTKTYISQHNNLDTDMVLRFDNEVVRAKNGSAPKDYLMVQKIDRVVWSVEHEELTAPFLSYSSDPDEPYYYKICTFYKKSDENPFYFREMPYLIINNGLADGYTKDDDYVRLSVRPVDSTATGGFSEEEVSYDLNVGSVFSGSAQQALTKLSYSAIGTGTDGISIANREDTFNFPGLSADGQTLEENVNPLDFDFGPKISDIDADNTLRQTIIDTYGNSTRIAIGQGEAGLRALHMPEVMVAAAQTKYPTATEDKENFAVLDYAPVSESGYELSLNGLYKQGNGSSWESYRWVLEKVRFDNTLNSEQISNEIKKGDLSLFDHIEETIVIKDTGNRHDKKINVIFYGLLDNLENSDNSDDIVGVGGKTLFSNVYLVTLYVTDENGITKSEKRLFEYKAPSKAFDYCVKSFEATMDCQKECVKISVSPEFIDSSLQPSANSNFPYLKEFSIFRREYKKLYQYNNGQKEEKILIGNRWDPVVLNLKATDASSAINLLDFNVKSGYSYQYVIFPRDYSASMVRVPYIYANTGKTERGASTYDQNNGWRPFSSRLSKPVRSTLQYWSIVNLIPAQEDSQIGTDISTYVADTDNVWMFKYQLENGSLTQNVSKNEFSTLGQYPKIGVGRKNFLSGSVSCYLGSEIIPLSKAGYIERTPASRNVPLSTNEKAFMVEKWRDLVATGTPKLLRDTKGQSWIVQIMDGTTTTNEAISIKPDTINFSWRQVADTNDVIIYARQDQADLNEVCSDEWQEDSNYE